MTVPKIGILGAYDRFNYGDLLFPVIIERVLGDYQCRPPLEYYGTTWSDLGRFGGKRTKAIRHLFTRQAMPDGSALILAGGDLLGETFAGTLDTLLPAPVAFMLRRLQNRLDVAATEALCRFTAGVELEFPWVVTPDDFSSRVKVAYNSVSGTGLRYLPIEKRRRIREKLCAASFISVRDTLTQGLLEPLRPDVPVRLAPDCAVLLSFFFPEVELQKRVSPETEAFVSALKHNYMCFQINRTLAKDNLRVIGAELEKIYRRYGLGVLLLPIGRARNHEDHVPLAQLAGAVRTPAVYAGAGLTIYDIMYLIARARAFAGTSLHGNITALSYGVPHLGLTERVTKLAAFLRTWDLPDQKECAPLEDLGDRLGSVLTIPKKDLERKRAELTLASRRNFDAMLKSIGVVEEAVAAEVPGGQKGTGCLAARRSSAGSPREG
jgi:hypothetical protein